MYFSYEIETVHTGHLDVGQYQVGLVLSIELQPFDSVAGSTDLITFLREHDLEELSHTRFIIDNQQAFSHAPTPFLTLPGEAVW